MRKNRPTVTAAANLSKYFSFGGLSETLSRTEAALVIDVVPVRQKHTCVCNINFIRRMKGLEFIIR